MLPAHERTNPCPVPVELEREPPPLERMLARVPDAKFVSAEIALAGKLHYTAIMLHGQLITALPSVQPTCKPLVP